MHLCIFALLFAVSVDLHVGSLNDEHMKNGISIKKLPGAQPAAAGPPRGERIFSEISSGGYLFPLNDKSGQCCISTNSTNIGKCFDDIQ